MFKKLPVMLALGATMTLLGACSTTPVAEPAPVSAAPVTTIPAQPVMTQPAQPTAPAYGSDEQMLLSQSPTAYTIQVLAAENPQTIANFRARYPGYSFYQIQTSRNGRPLSVLLQGIYNSESSANQAKRGLPMDTWVRDLGSVQQQIRAGSIR